MISMASLTTAFVFLRSLGLKLISESRGAVELIFIFVLGGLILGLPVGVLFVFLCRWAIAFQALEVNFFNIKGWL